MAETKIESVTLKENDVQIAPQQDDEVIRVDSHKNQSYMYVCNKLNRICIIKRNRKRKPERITVMNMHNKINENENNSYDCCYIFGYLPFICR